MFCPSCGKQCAPGAQFCDACGAPLGGSEDASQRPTPNIQLCADGVYRWFYPFDMRKNPTILFTVWNVMAISVGVTFLIVALIDLADGGMNEFLGLLKIFFFILLGALFLGFVAYLILASMYGWRYLVIFEMDQNGVLHKQMDSQFDRVQALAWLSLLTARTPQVAGSALLAASKSESYVRFGALRSVKVQSARHTIKVNERLEHSQVYAAPEDFDFVLNYILAHIPEGTKVL